MKEAAVEWLAKASEDLLAVEKLSEDEHLTNIAAFHAQQCVEKSLKAILEEFGQKVPRTHDLIRLNGLAQSCISLGIEENILHELSTVYLESRYPSDFGMLPQGKPSTGDVERYLKAAEAIYGKVKSLLVRRDEK